MRSASERGLAKMAASSDLLKDVFFNAEGAEKVKSDLIGFLDSEPTAASHVNAIAGTQSAANHGDNTTARSTFNRNASKMGLSQQELAKAGAGVQKRVSGSAGCLAPSMDGAPETIVQPAHSQPKPLGDSGVGTDAPAELDKPTGAPSLNGGGSVGVTCHAPSDSSPLPVAPLNGPAPAGEGETAAVSVTPGTIIRTTSNTQNIVTSSVISGQPCVKTVPTVTLMKPPNSTPLSTAVVMTSSSPVVSVTASPLTAKSITPAGPTPVVTSTMATMRSATVWPSPRPPGPSIATAAPSGVRGIAPQVLAPRLSQPQQNATNIQNIQLPPGIVLVCSESGQLLMFHQQTLAQMQAQSQSQSAMTPRPAAPPSTPPAQTPLQTPGAPLLTRSVTSTAIIKQGAPVQTTGMTTTTLQNTIMLGVTASGQPVGTSTKVQPAVGAAGQRVGTPGSTVTSTGPTQVTAETLDNVKKCRNFLSTLIKLASGKQSPETTANVKELVKSLLEAKIEPEDFTSKLYQELKSSPQPCLVPFLKRSLPALRQMTPDPDVFIQQSLLPIPSTQSTTTASTALTAVVLRPLSTAGTASVSTATPKATVINLAQTPNSKPSLIVSQQQGNVVKPQGALAPSPVVAIRSQAPSRFIVGQPQGVKQPSIVPAVKQSLASGIREVQVLSQTSLIDAQRNKLKETGGGSFKDDDDINDVASMAGVNLLEENARILATGSDLVGMVTRSCKDETFLSIPSLTRISLAIGKKFGVCEMGSDVISYISHATQQRLQTLLEKASLVAYHKNMALKDDERSEQMSDVRSQLKFFDQLDQMEKQRKEEQEREILLRAAKVLAQTSQNHQSNHTDQSNRASEAAGHGRGLKSRQEDPEQLRLKQKAKEMQQLELAQIRQREANLAALAAIGPRKKRKTDSPVRGASADGSASGPSPSGGSNGPGSRQFTRQRITRVNLRDLLFCLESEKETTHSQLLYKGFLK